MPEIKLTKEERKTLKEFLYSNLETKSEYHYDLYPSKKDSLATLMQRYFYWGDVYNDDYIPEESYKEPNKTELYLVQEFKKFMAIPVAVRY
jgi:hypothetical protein